MKLSAKERRKIRRGRCSFYSCPFPPIIERSDEKVCAYHNEFREMESGHIDMKIFQTFAELTRNKYRQRASGFFGVERSGEEKEGFRIGFSITGISTRTYMGRREKKDKRAPFGSCRFRYHLDHLAVLRKRERTNYKPKWEEMIASCCALQIGQSISIPLKQDAWANQLRSILMGSKTSRLFKWTVRKNAKLGATVITKEGKYISLMEMIA